MLIYLSEPTVSRILFFFSVTLEEATIIYLAERLLARSSDLPGSFRRATLERSPIWSCSVWGLPCLRCHHRSGALLPHLFTLTASATEAEEEAVYFLWHFPSGHPDWSLASTLPCGVRTFLSLPEESQRSSGRLEQASLL